jgi:dienelactone hydrolase
MCDQDHFDDDLKKYSAKGAVSRRQFGALSVGAGMMALLPRAANAQAVTESDVKIKTPDGTCDAYFVHPAAHGWCQPDSAVYDEKQAEKAWGRMLVPFKKALA